MARTPAELSDAELSFLHERHLATLTTLRSDGSPHVVAIAFTYDSGSETVRIITTDGTQKVVNAEEGERAAVCQVDGRRWLSLEGAAGVGRHPQAVADAERRYALRYRSPRPNPRRVVIEIDVDRVLGHA